MQALRRGALLVALLALVAAPVASASPAEGPQITDPADQRNPSVDLRAAWLEPEEDGLRFTLEVERLSQPTPDLLYWIRFEINGLWQFAAVGFDGEANFLTYVGPSNGPAWDRAGFEKVANQLLRGEQYELGGPARFTAVIPWERMPYLEPGATLQNISVGTTVFHRQMLRWSANLDAAATDLYVVPEAPSGVQLPSGTLPLLGLALAGAGTAGLLARRPRETPSTKFSGETRPEKGVPAAQEPPARLRPPRDKRFRLDPRDSTVADADRGKTRQL